MPRTLTLLILATLLAPAALAQSQHSTHTLELDEGATPKGTLADVAWIAGHWRGEALGGTAEEIWSPPLGNSMMGVYRLVKDGQVSFYEILTIAAESETLILRLKHFHPDLAGWEERGESVDFPLVRAEPGKAYFSGMTFLLKDEDTLEVYVANRQKDGTVGELAFLYRRFRPAPTGEPEG